MQPKKILIIDDNPHIRSIYSDILNMHGYSTMVAINGEDALKLLEDSSSLPDLIILDLEMPVVNGQEFRKRQLEDNRLKDLPVIISSASIDLEIEIKNLGIKKFISKPASIEELVEKVGSFFQLEESY